MSYTKYHDPWTSLHEPTGKAWNHLESQWDAIKTDADAHTHDSRYYTKTLSDNRFFALATSRTLGADADKLDGQHFSDILAAVMPIGAIMIWSGTSASIPDGWAICNGQVIGGYATPDLRNRFVIGAGNSYSPGNTGGAFSTALSGSITIGSHAISGDEMPLHAHTYTDRSDYLVDGYNFACYTGCGATSSYYTRTTGATGGGTAHGHSGSTISMNNLNCVPPYMALYYIMKYR